MKLSTIGTALIIAFLSISASIYFSGDNSRVWDALKRSNAFSKVEKFIYPPKPQPLAPGTPTQIVFWNKRETPVDIFWSKSDNDVPQGTIVPGHTLGLNVFSGHVFLAFDHFTSEMLGKFTIDGLTTDFHLTAESRVKLARGDPLRVVFHNQCSFPVNLFFEKAESQVNMGLIAPGAEKGMNVFVGHTMFAADSTTFDVLARFVIDGTTRKFVINPLPEGSVAEKVQRDSYEQVMSRSADEKLLWERELAERMRLRINKEQPPIVTKFTPLGFSLRKVPEGIWQEILKFFNTHRHLEVKEQWPPADIYVNHWESPTTMIHLPDALKNKIHDVVRPILSEWVGGLELERTVVYGIRLYKNDSLLLDHVDRIQTHAVSCIINVDQKVTEPWPLDIYSHDGEKHTYFLQPGEMLLYESAACIHGRQQRFRGEYYANLFVHFRPTNWEFKNYIF
eukprot:TRINITY_DN9783_c0_g1_i1.p1 TRINITY_DN9783_c0_g1~~TRINITY_DN9783_c0_g1_i1.p1  ORF type:complete len:450 (-),score=117.40 TRINITY_DN9783_c0_g1_i1:46-1395(-)